MTRAFTFLVNPTSGGGAAPKAVVPVARLLRDAGAAVEVTYSPGPKATVALVGDAVSRGEVVVSVGGDGMLSSVAGEVAARGGTLGIVPAGRGNDFARMLGLSDEPEAVAKVLLEASPRSIDLIEVTHPNGTKRVVAGSVYAGVDAHAAAMVDRMRWTPASCSTRSPASARWLPSDRSPARSPSTAPSTRFGRPRWSSPTPPTTAPG
ncbi:diacylglycerol/lipid kinase family protein [Nocardioides alcanivorans]|uniref:diacylglycerol/lipid kinase family protein n=1 Tax=Nocardioides alcanivorans TaxID=2897352 RepID=UPI001F2E11A1|nr:acylglycerol kinase family protein [Nocardioides alcanivorans]